MLQLCPSPNRSFTPAINKSCLIIKVGLWCLKKKKKKKILNKWLWFSYPAISNLDIIAYYWICPFFCWPLFYSNLFCSYTYFRRQTTNTWQISDFKPPVPFPSSDQYLNHHLITRIFRESIVRVMQHKSKIKNKNSVQCLALHWIWYIFLSCINHHSKLLPSLPDSSVAQSENHACSKALIS
jgi:hypothetical protein